MTINKDIIEEEATSLKEWIVLPGRTPLKCTPDKIKLSQEICGIFFRFPIMPAAMSCLYYGKKHELALKSSKEGMPPVIHYNQPINDQVNIIKTIKKETIPKEGIELKESFISVNYKDPLEKVLKAANKFGHSVIPVLDRFSNFYGVFIKPFYEITEDPETPVSKLKEPIYYKKRKLVTGHIDMSEQEIKDKLKKLEKLKKENGLKQTFLPILDDKGKLIKLAFLKKFKAYQCGAAISTHPGWEERAKACIDAGADFIVIDTSDGHSDFEINVAKKFKKKYPNVPLVGGNIVTADAFNDLKEYVDIIKVGMMTGCSCTTGSVKNVGRPLFAALKEIRKARNAYVEQGGKYIPIIADGGISNPIEMTVALKFADLTMAGKYFAQFFESAGEAFDKDKKPTKDENLIKFKEYWGEGSNKAKNLARYGHVSTKTSLEEGAYGYVPYRGRLKPCVEEDFKAVKATLSNAGCMNLKEFREKARLQKLSPTAMRERHPSSDVEVIELK